MNALDLLTDEQLERIARELEANAQRSSRIVTVLMQRGVDHADIVRVREAAQRAWQGCETVMAELARRRGQS